MIWAESGGNNGRICNVSAVWIWSWISRAAADSLATVGSFATCASSLGSKRAINSPLDFPELLRPRSLQSAFSSGMVLFCMV